MKKLLVVAASLSSLIAISLCAPSKETHKTSNTTYDQRQVGKYNIHFNIKDVSIIALSSEDIVDHIGDSDSYSDYYDYEDSEYTVNPITADLSGRPTTKKPNATSLIPSIAGLNLTSISTSTVPPLVSTSPQTLVFIHENPSTEGDKNANKTSYQPDEIPVQVIVEPLLKPKIRPSIQSMKRKLTNRQVSGITEDDVDVIKPRRRRGQIIDRIRSRRAHNKRNGNGCGHGETRDGEGGCRVRRSGLTDFFEMLTRFLPQRDTN